MFIALASVKSRTPLGAPCSRWSRRLEFERAGAAAVLGVHARNIAHLKECRSFIVCDL